MVSFSGVIIVDWRDWFGEDVPRTKNFDISTDGRIIFEAFEHNIDGKTLESIYLFDTNDETLTRLTSSEEGHRYSDYAPRWIYDELLEKDLFPIHRGRGYKDRFNRGFIKR